MAFSKAPQYPDHLRVPAFYARAFAHPERLAILRYLHTHGASCVEDLVRQSMLSQPAISQHLAVLRKAGLVDYREEPPFTFYSVTRPDLAAACITLQQALSDFQRKLDWPHELAD